MDELCGALLGNDNDRRKQAEAYLQQLKAANPTFVIQAFVNGLESDPHQPHRLMFSILLRGITLRETSLWKSLSSEEYSQCRVKLLHALMNEPLAFIQRKIIDLIAVHAKLDQWPELMDSIVQMHSSGEAKWQEISLLTLEKLAEHVGPFLVANLGPTLSIISSGLDSPKLDTRNAAALALCSLVMELNDFDEAVVSSFSRVVAILRANAEAENDSNLQDLFTSLSRVLESKAVLFTGIWGSIFELSSLICQSPDLQDLTKISALDLCMSLLRNSTSKKFCSNAESRQAFLRLAMSAMLQVEDDDGGVAFFTRPDSSSGFGDTDGDEQSNFAEFGSVCLNNMAETFPPAETIACCLPAAATFIQQADWRSRRAALFIVCIICDGTREEIYPHLGRLVATATSCLTDVHPRVRYSAVHCLSVLIEDFTADEDEELGPSFQELFSSTVPPKLFAAIEANSSFPRIIHTAIGALKTFFNPSSCEKQHCEPYSACILDYCCNALVTRALPSFILEDVASLAGNVSILSPLESLAPRFAGLMSALQTIAFSQPDAGQSSHDSSLLRGRCLESIALVGSAAGKEVFRDEALRILSLLCEVQRSGLDFSDPLSSFILQACARLAGIVGSDFEPFLLIVLPPLLSRIAEPITVQILDDSLSADAADADSENIFSIYKRGVGQLRIHCNTHAITEKEMACRVAVQYCFDVPMLLWPHCAEILEAVSPHVESFQMSEDLALVCGSLISESVKIFWNFCTWDPPRAASSLNYLVDGSLKNLLAGLEKTQLMKNNEDLFSSLSLALLDPIREILKVVWESNYLIEKIPAAIDPALGKLLLTTLRDQVVISMQINFVDETEASILSIEEDIRVWDSLIDCFSWMVKIFGVSQQQLFVDEVLPLLQGILGTPDCPTTLLSISLSCLVEAVDVMPALASTGSAALVPILLKHIDNSELALLCAHGLGVCAMRGGESVSSLAHPIAVKLCVLLAAVRDSSEDEVVSVRDNLISGLFKVLIYQPHALPAAPRLEVLHSVLCLMPTKLDVFSSRSLNDLLVSLVETASPALVDKANPTIMCQILSVLIQLASTPVFEGQEDIKVPAEYWNEQIVNPMTLQRARAVLASWALDASFVTPLVAMLPREIVDLLKTIGI